MSKEIKLAFAKFWGGFDPEDNFFYRLLNKDYDVVISDTPDIVIFSVFGGEFPEGDYQKVFFTGENIRPDMNECDWAFGFDYEDSVSDDRYMRLPLALVECSPESLLEKRPSGELIQDKSRFCNFLYWNEVEFREHFYSSLSEYKSIDSPGRSMNNMPPLIDGESVQKTTFIEKLKTLFTKTDYMASRAAVDWRTQKAQFLSQYRFTIAFENSSYPGYFTEKIIDPMMVGSIPIYWGNEEILRDGFNPKAFLNYRDFSNEQSLIERIKEIDSDETEYRKMLDEPWFVDGALPQWADINRIRKRLREIAEAR